MVCPIQLKCLRFENSVEKELYRNTVYLDMACKFDYDAVIKVLKLLYPKTEFVSFCIQID